VQLERFAKPRWKIMTHDIVYRFAALCCLVLALVILVPGPFTNIPPGVAIALFGFAMVERDGMLMLISFIAGIIGFHHRLVGGHRNRTADRTLDSAERHAVRLNPTGDSAKLKP
jgi:hypothetical protein